MTRATTPGPCDVAWGDGLTESFAYPCAAAGPCPFSLTATHPLGLEVAPPGQQWIYFRNEHVYSAPGTHAVNVTISDDEDESDTKSTAAVIAGIGTLPTAPTISGTPPGGIVGTAYGPFTFTVGGDPSPTVFAATGTLPTGLTLSSSGILSGTPTAKGSFSFTARASNGVVPNADDAVTIAIAGKAQSISFGGLSAKTYGAPAFDVGATATSELTVSFTAAPSNVCTAGGSAGATITIVSVGTCAVTAHQAGDATTWDPASDVERTFGVGPKGAIVSVTPASVAYSDPVPALNVFGSVSGLVGGDNLAGTLAGCTANGLAISGTGKVLSPAGAYPLTGCAGLSNANYSVSYSGALTVVKESATAAYTGPTYVATGSATATKANVTLTGQLTQDADGSPGDLTKATVDFLLYNSGNLTLTTPDLTVAGTVAASGTVTGTASNLSVDTYTVVLRIRPANTWFAGPESDADVLTVYTPATGVWVSGGGWLTDPSYLNIPVQVSPTRTKGKFGFNVQYAKKGSTAPKGNVTYSFRGVDGYVYVIKSSSWQGGLLALSGEHAAYFVSKCVVVARDPRTGLPVPGIGGGNYSCRVDIVDGGAGGSNDTYALSVNTPSGALYHRVGTAANPIAVQGGNVSVHVK